MKKSKTSRTNPKDFDNFFYNFLFANYPVNDTQLMMPCLEAAASIQVRLVLEYCVFIMPTNKTTTRLLQFDFPNGIFSIS